MDIFREAQHYKVGIGGFKCSCCNNLARKKRGRLDRRLNRVARARIKSKTRKIILDSLLN